MATYRTVYMSFWTDPKVGDEFTPEEKYFYLYLLTNPHTNLCGCYEIGMKAMRDETGYNEDTVKRLLDRMQNTHDVIRYNPQTKEVLIINWCKYNWVKSKDTYKGIQNVAENIKCDGFRTFIYDTLSAVFEGGVQTPYRGAIDPVGVSVTVPVTVTDTNTVSDSNTDSNPNKSKPKKTKQVYTDGFEEFWEAYPRKTSKEEAKKSWNTLKPDKELQKIILQAIDAWKKTDQWSEPRYIPHPSTWLNQKRWTDEAPKKKDPFEGAKRAYQEALAREQAGEIFTGGIL